MSRRPNRTRRMARALPVFAHALCMWAVLGLPPSARAQTPTPTSTPRGDRGLGLPAQRPAETPAMTMRYARRRAKGEVARLVGEAIKQRRGA